MKKHKTSWTDDELQQLCDINNHRIIYDGYNYVWENKMNNVWTRRTVFYYDTFAKPYSVLKYWIACWSKELIERKELKVYNTLKGDALNMYRAFEICKLDYLKNKEKTKRIKKLIPHITDDTLSYMIGVHRVTINRYLNE